MNTINKNNKWYDSNHNFYKINKIFLKDNNSWVEYTKEATGDTYSCLQEAFLYRFKEQLA